jgi:outer membrane protein TolC
MKTYRLLLVLLLFSMQGLAQEKAQYSLEEIIARAKALSPQALRIQTQKENMYWRYRFFRSNYNPQLRLTGVLPSFRQEFTDITQPNGDIEFLEIRQNLVDLGLGLQQVIAPTGGMLSVNTSANRFDNFLATGSDIRTRYSGVPMNVSLNQPIFAYNPYKWDKRIEPLVFEESKREYVAAMEQLSGVATSIFFEMLEAQVNLDIAQTNLQYNQEIYRIEKARYEMGSTFEDKLLQIELAMLTSKQEAAQAKVNLETSSLRLKSNLGLNESAEITLLSPEEYPVFPVDVDKAISLAFENRAEALGFKRRKLEADAQVAEAKGERMQMNLAASYGLNNAALTWADIYRNPDNQALVNLALSVPVLDWGRNKARMSLAQANKKLVEYEVAQEVINFEQEIFTKVKNFQMLEERLSVSKLSSDVAQKRYDLAVKRYQTGNVSLTDLNIAQQEKDSSKRSYVGALRDYWLAYFELRQLTLYDFESGQLLYVPEVEDTKP